MNVKSKKRQDMPITVPICVAMSNRILHDLNFRDRINDLVNWDPRQCEMSPGALASALILATSSPKRPPLYKIGKWYESQNIDVTALFGRQATPAAINDDKLGRMLDKLAEQDMGNLFIQLAGTAVLKYEIAFNRLHSDTTSISFEGEYEVMDLDGSRTRIVKILQGYSKDHKPECKQIVVGKIVNEHGVPLAFATMDGNTSDFEWNRDALGLLEQMQQNGLKQGYYIADSKLMSEELFRRMNEPERKIPFISRVPANFAHKLEREMLGKAYSRNAWQSLGQLSGGKKACNYECQSFTETIYGSPVRILVIRTSAGTERYGEKLKRWQDELQEKIVEVQSKTFACQKDAEKEYDRFLTAMKKNPYRTVAAFTSETTEKNPVGRPSAKAPKTPVFSTLYRLEVVIGGLDEAKLAPLKEQSECFVVITNALDLSDREVLAYYKEQQVVEIDFKYLKEESRADTIFVKNPNRIAAFMLLMHIALLVDALLQYRLRKGRHSWTKPIPKIGWNGAKMMENPTTYYLISMLSCVYYIRNSIRDMELELVVKEGQEEQTTDILMEMLGWSHEELVDALNM